MTESNVWGRRTYAPISCDRNLLCADLIIEKVTPLLVSRIRCCIALWKKQEKPSYLIMSGGQGLDEVISEAEAMKRYAVQQGVIEEWIIMEDQSKNTKQNLHNSYGIIKESYLEYNHRAAIVTNYSHIFCAVFLARKLGTNESDTVQDETLLFSKRLYPKLYRIRRFNMEKTNPRINPLFTIHQFL